MKKQVALRKGDNAEPFNFSGSWTAPSTVIILPSGQLTLINNMFPVADDDLSCELFFIGWPMLEHLNVCSNKSFNIRCAIMDGADWPKIGNSTLDNRGGTITPIMVACINHFGNPESEIHENVE